MGVSVAGVAAFKSSIGHSATATACAWQQHKTAMSSDKSSGVTASASWMRHASSFRRAGSCSRGVGCTLQMR